MLSRKSCLAILLLSVCVSELPAADGFRLKRCEIIPLPGHQASFQIDGVEKFRWHYGEQYTRPFFYPMNGPSGTSLTRIGHPGAENHDHHRSVWFAHHDVNGFDFWSENGRTQVRQKLWYAYRDGDDEAVMANCLGWYDSDGNELMEQDVVTALIPRGEKEHLVEIQITTRPAKKAKAVELKKTSFGFLAVRVAKTVSAYFGGGIISSSEGWVGEPSIFGKASRWVDYSGPVAVGTGVGRKSVIEGITYFDHPGNVDYPAKWHVREDGWIGASVCRDEDRTVAHEKPLVLRYLLHVHAGGYDHEKAVAIQRVFAKRPGFSVGKRKRKHRQYEVWRIGSEEGSK